MRLFFALDLPEALKAELAEFQGIGRAHGLPATWQQAGNLHLTLAFLGEQPESQLPALRDIGGRIAGRCPWFPLSTAGLGGFPRPSQARVLFLGLEANARLTALADELQRDLADRGFVLDRKPFAAHLTLARFRAPVDIHLFEPGPAPREFEASELILYRSHLGAKGSQYERIGVFPFA